MKVLVTGASGFVGGWLVDALVARGDEVNAWTRDNTSRPGEGVTASAVDITDAEAVRRAYEAASPTLVIHLAAQSFPARSWTTPRETMRVNIEGTLNILEAARAAGSSCRLLVCGSSAQYAVSLDPSPQREDAAQSPLSPYGVSKIAADQLAVLYGRAYGLDIVRFRPFALIGPGKTGDAASDFARRIVAIERGGEPRLIVGDLSPVRDFMHVRDGVTAVLAIAERGLPGGVYNIATGKSTSIASLLELFRHEAKTPFELVTNRSIVRPVDDPIKVGDATALRALGWKPETSLGETVAEVIEYWRNRP